MGLKKVKIHLDEKGTITQELNAEEYLNNIRKQLLDKVYFPFIFLDEDENEISKEEELSKKLSDVLDGKNLYIKKEIKKRKILGEKIHSEGDLDYYLYPKFEMNIMQEECSSNIMVIGETGTGKSTWIHAMLNYMEDIQIEENTRYLLFNEKALQKQYEIKNGKKPKGSSVTDTPEIYNIMSSKVYNNPIRIIDTAGFGDTRGKEYDEKITKDIQELFESSRIDNLNAICIIFKATETRVHDRAKDVLDKLFLLFGEEIKKNIVIIFTFADSFEDFPAMTTLKDETSPFAKILGDIEKLQYFAFNNKAYFSNDRKTFSTAYENNTKNFGKLLKYIFSLRRISLESTKKVIRNRTQIKCSISNLIQNLEDIKLYIISSLKNQQKLLLEKKDLEILQNAKYPLEKYFEEFRYYEIEEKEVSCSSGWYVLYCCYHGYVCQQNCRGSREGWNSNEYGCDMIKTFGGDCTHCGCNWRKHSFRSYYKVKQEVPRVKTIEKFRENPELKAQEEKDKESKREIQEIIEKRTKEINDDNNKIYSYLMSGIECLHTLSIKNKELNEIALKKDDKRNGYILRALSDNKKENDKVFDFFEDSLNNIEYICQDKDIKNQTVEKFMSSLLNESVE